MKQTIKLVSLLLVLSMLAATAVPVLAVSGEPRAITGEGINYVNVTDITAPALGATPDFDIALDGTGAAFSTEYVDIQWGFCDPVTREEYELGEDSVIEQGLYCLHIALDAEEGYVFTEDTRFYFGGIMLPSEAEVYENYTSFYWCNELYADIYLWFTVKEEPGYTVSFNANGGTGTMASERVDGKYTLPRCTFKAPPRSVFLGWGVGDTLYNAGDIIKVTEDITATAIWARTTSANFVVTYYGSGGSGTMRPQLVGSGDFELPWCGYLAPLRQVFKAYLIDGTEYQPGDVIQITSNTLITVLWQKATANVRVKGTVTSFNDPDGAITLSLIKAGETAAAYETTVTGNTAEYSFSNVASGTYVLQVQKEGHVTREYDVTVVALSVTCDVTICPRGDVTGDGKINIMDVVKLYAHVKGTPITDDYALACGDVTGDNKANIMDVVKVYAYVKGVAFL